MAITSAARPAIAAASPARTLSRARPLFDLTAVSLAALVALAGATGTGALDAAVAAFYGLIALGILHRGSVGWREGSLLDELRQILVATSVSALVVTGACALVGIDPHTELSARLWLFAAALLVVARITLHHTTRTQAAAGRPTLIVGAGSVGAELASRLQRQPALGLRPVGFLDDTDDAAIEPPTGAAGSLPILGGLDQLSAAAARSEAACVVFAFSRAPDRSLVPLVERCERLGLTVLVVPRLFETINCRMRLRHVDALPIGELQWVNPRSVQFAVKYALDRAAAAILTLVLAPLMLLIAALVRAGSPGPALYRQRRVGLDGREFTMFKFRTLRADPSPAPPSDLPPGCAPGGAEYAGQCTALGAWLRRSSLDELPQLFNVLRGEMSLVGPRPERPIYVHRFADEVSRYGRRHRVKSGITGLAQVSGLRGRTSIAERTRYDNFYIQNWSLWLDLKIALRTVASVLTLSGE